MLKVAQAANILEYQCGCKCIYQLIGQFAKLKEFHIIPCYEHVKDLRQVEKQAEEDWERITSEVRA